MSKNVKAWIKGLFVVVIVAIAGFILQLFADPEASASWTWAQWKVKLLIAIVIGVAAGAGYLAKSPLPRAIFFILSFCLSIVGPLAGVSQAEMNWRTANQITIGWDPVTTLADGSPLPAGESFVYKIYIRTDPAGTPVATNQIITTTSATITFTTEGSFDIGVSTVRFGNNMILAESAIAWSNDPKYVQGGNTFGGKYFLPGGMITNMR